LGAARTFHNLSAVANARGQYDDAEEWLRKSIDVKEDLGEMKGVAASFHQLGNVCWSREAFDSAEEWFSRAREVYEELDDAQGVAMSCLSLHVLSEERGDPTAERWRDAAAKTLQQDGTPRDAVSLGNEAERRMDLDAAAWLYTKALEIAEAHGDDESRSASLLWFGRLVWKNGDFERALECYEKSVAIDEALGAVKRATSTCIGIAAGYTLKDADRRVANRQAGKWYNRAIALNKDASWTERMALRWRILSSALRVGLREVRKDPTDNQSKSDGEPAVQAAGR
jgi:tetratricopeptide (TPR) repeat protein